MCSAQNNAVIICMNFIDFSLSSANENVNVLYVAA